MNLIQLQRAVRENLLSDAPDIAGEVRGKPDRGLAVYRHAYRAQLVASLADTYEKVWAWLGDDAFEDVARRHVEAHPPHSWTLSDYGKTFIDTLADAYPDDPEVAELAWLGWSLRRAFDGPDFDAVAQEALLEVDWDNAVIEFVPTLRLGVLTTNAAAIWSALAEAEMPPEAQPLATSAGVRVWRQDLSPQYRTISLEQLRTLHRAQGGATFAEICAPVGEGASGAPEVVGQMLGEWLLDGLIRRVGPAR